MKSFELLILVFMASLAVMVTATNGSPFLRGTSDDRDMSLVSVYNPETIPYSPPRRSDQAPPSEINVIFAVQEGIVPHAVEDTTTPSNQ